MGSKPVCGEGLCRPQDSRGVDGITIGSGGFVFVISILLVLPGPDASVNNPGGLRAPEPQRAQSCGHHATGGVWGQKLCVRAGPWASIGSSIPQGREWGSVTVTGMSCGSSEPGG